MKTKTLRATFMVTEVTQRYLGNDSRTVVLTPSTDDAGERDASNRPYGVDTHATREAEAARGRATSSTGPYPGTPTGYLTAPAGTEQARRDATTEGQERDRSSARSQAAHGDPVHSPKEEPPVPTSSLIVLAPQHSGDVPKDQRLLGATMNPSGRMELHFSDKDTIELFPVGAKFSVVMTSCT